MIRLRWKVLYWLAFTGAAALAAAASSFGAASAIGTAFFALGWLACEYHLLGYDKGTKDG